MLVDKLKKTDHFTDTEKVIAAYILAHLNEVPDLSADELARQTFTSKSAITRFCHKLKAGSYQDLKKTLDWESHELSRISGRLAEAPISSATTLKEIKDLLPGIYEDAITNTKLEINPNALQRSINRLRSAAKIEIYGTGITMSLAEAAAFKFLSIGYESAAYAGINEHYIINDAGRHTKTAILLSFTGANPLIVRSAQYLRRQGMYTIGIGGDQEDLKKVCHEYFHLSCKRQILGMEVITSAIAAEYILDIFFAALFVEHYSRNIETSEKVKNQEN